MELKFKISMFVTSFLPVWVMIVISNTWSVLNTLKGEKFDIETIYNFSCITEVISVIIIVILCIYSIYTIENVIVDKEDYHIHNRKITNVQEKQIAIDYIVTTTLSFLAFDFSMFKDFSLFCVYFIMLGYMCVKKNNYYINIYLLYKGYDIYICKLREISTKSNAENDRECIVISKTKLDTGNDNLYELDNVTYLKLENIEVDNVK